MNYTELGLMKLEGNNEQAIFLAPKVYALKNQVEEIIKIKVLTKDLTNKFNIELLDKLLTKDSSKQITQNKWFKNIELANIQILEQLYTLKVTENKRKLIPYGQ